MRNILQRINAQRQHLRRVDVRRGKQAGLERLEIYFLDVGDVDNEDACKTGRGHVVDNAGHDGKDKGSYEDSSAGDGAGGGRQRQGEDGEAGFEFGEV
jgi:hypothetical protein